MRTRIDLLPQKIDQPWLHFELRSLLKSRVSISTDNPFLNIQSRIMEATSYLQENSQPNDLDLSFNKYYLRHSKSLLVVLGLAAVYCLGYGVLIVQEFSKMGIIDSILNGK